MRSVVFWSPPSAPERMNMLNRTPGTPGTSGTLRTESDAARGSVVPGVPKVPEVRFNPGTPAPSEPVMMLSAAQWFRRCRAFGSCHLRHPRNHGVRSTHLAARAGECGGAARAY